MTRLLFILIAALVVGLGAAWLADTGGMVTLIVADYEIRTSAAMAAAFLFAACILLFILFRLLSFVVRGPEKLSSFLIQRRAGKAYHVLAHGLVAAAAGDAQAATQAARHAEKLLGKKKNPLALLLNAKAAELGKSEEHQHAACSAMLTHPETEFLGAQGLSALSMRRGDADQALGFALRAHALKPDSDNAAAALFDLRIARGERAEAQSLLEEALKAKRLSPDTEQRWRDALRTLEPAEGDLPIPNGGSAPT